MCLNPQYIKNPSYHAEYHPLMNSHGTVRHNEHYAAYQSLLNIAVSSVNKRFAHLRVPCGHCAECASLKQSYLSQRAELMSTDHFVFYQTLTLQNKYMKSVDVCGVKNNYFDIKYFQDYVMMLRKYRVLGTPHFKYLACTEYGGLKHRPHMHILYFVPKDQFFDYTKCYPIESKCRSAIKYFEETRLFWEMLRYWRINNGSRRVPVWDKLLLFARSRDGRRNYDFQFVEDSNSRLNVMYYVTKYILKYDNFIVRKQQAFKLNLSDSEYREKWNLVRPRLLLSKNFGNSSSYADIVRKSFEYSLKNINNNQERWFFLMSAGKVVPMSPYIRKAFVSSSDSLDMYMRTESHYDEPDLNFNDTKARNRMHFNKVFMLCRSRNNFDFYDIE